VAETVLRLYCRGMAAATEMHFYTNTQQPGGREMYATIRVIREKRKNAYPQKKSERSHGTVAALLIVAPRLGKERKASIGAKKGKEGGKEELQEQADRNDCIWREGKETNANAEIAQANHEKCTKRGKEESLGKKKNLRKKKGKEKMHSSITRNWGKDNGE